MCPLCLVSFEKKDVVGAGRTLTEDHVPPDALGWTMRVLTCRTCNNTAGHTVDIEMKRWHKINAFGTPLAEPLPIVSTVDGVSQRGELIYDGDAFKIIGVKKQNHPGTAEAVSAVYDDWTQSGNSGQEIKAEISVKFNERLGRIGWLRSAYLAAFGFWGYRWALQPQVEAIRQQIKQPTADLLPLDRLVYVDTTEPHERRLVTEVVSPDLLAGSFAVIFGWYVILLPGMRDVGIYDVLRNHPPGDFEITFQKGFAPSQRPGYRLDG